MVRITDIHPNLKSKSIEEVDIPELSKQSVSLRLMLTVFIVTLSSHFHYGYQVGVPNTAGVALKEFFNNSYERQLGEVVIVECL